MDRLQTTPALHQLFNLQAGILVLDTALTLQIQAKHKQTSNVHSAMKAYIAVPVITT